MLPSPAGPVVQAVPGSLEWGAQEVGVASGVARFDLVNDTAYEVIVQDQGSFEGTHPIDFHTPDGQGPYTGLGFINPGGRYTVSVVFQPNAGGPRSGSAHLRFTIRRQINQYGAYSDTSQDWWCRSGEPASSLVPARPRT